MTLPDHMDCREAAARWRTTAAYVKKLCADGRVRAHKIGGVWVLDRDQPSPIRRARKGESENGKI